MLLIQLQRADKSLPQLGEEVERSAQESHMPADRFAAGQAADSLVDHSLEDRNRKILLRSAFIDQRLDIRLGKHTAAGRDGVDRLVIFGVLIQPCRIRLQQRRHLVDKRTRAAGTDSVHTLFYTAAVKVNDLGILTAQFDRNIRLRSKVLQRRGDRDHLLYKRYSQMSCQSQSPGARDHRDHFPVADLFDGAPDQHAQGLLNIRIMTFVVRKKKLLLWIKDSNFDCGRSDVNTKCILHLFIHIGF